MLQVTKKKQLIALGVILVFAVILITVIFTRVVLPKVKSEQEQQIETDLPEILKKGKLVVLAENSSSTYFLYRNKKMGFEYEVLKEFADELGLTLEIKVIHDLDSLNIKLNNGEGDIIACNYTYSKDRLAEIEFSEPLLLTPQVLIQRKPLGWKKMSGDELNKHLIRSPEELAGKKVHVWSNSSYHKRLLNLQEETGDTIYIEEVNGLIGSDELIEMVAEGMIDYTVVEENIARINDKYYDNLDISTVLSVKQKICFGLRKENPLLKARLDTWLVQFKKKKTYNYLTKKYFDNTKLITSYDFTPANLKRGEISPYDDIFKEESNKYGIDWRLPASIAYHESRFNPNALGFGGSYGIMQFMPGTGPRYGVYPNSTPKVQIAGGVKKLHKDYESWSEIPDQEQRYKFCLATYNAGKGHVEDAQRLARKKGLDPLKWDDNVEKMMLNLGKQEYYRDAVVQNGAHHGALTHRYVREIYGRYLEWKSVYK
jgi:membrane-bound lytic murein transglycosylase F